VGKSRRFWGQCTLGISSACLLFVQVKKFGAGNGAYALITGSTDGIGKEFALQLAKLRFNIILVSRTLSKLELVQKEIGKFFS
jgi:17beta-estradiol 17-dehydrogenase / very-long-chain 3-oxoacyl-CoA reductase